MALIKAKDTVMAYRTRWIPFSGNLALSSKIRIKESRSFQTNIQETRSDIAHMRVRTQADVDGTEACC